MVESSAGAGIRGKSLFYSATITKFYSYFICGFSVVTGFTIRGDI